jgi:hypothetical protein
MREAHCSSSSTVTQTNFARRARELLSIDLRTLALVRVLAAALVLTDLALKSRHIVAFYTDAGVLPRALWLRLYSGDWSLHLAAGDPTLVRWIFVVHALCAVSMLVGYRTRTASVLVWLLTASLDGRNPVIEHAGDNLLAVTLFWGMFVPWGARASVDAALSLSAPAPKRAFGLGTIAMLLQMPLVYVVAGLLKTGPEWHSDFTAVRNALLDDSISSEVGTTLGQLPLPLLKGVTISVLVFEIGTPLILFFPFKTDRVRLGFIGMLTLMQLGFGSCLRIGLFPLISTTATLAFLPSLFWDGVAAFHRRRVGLGPSLYLRVVEVGAGPARRLRGLLSLAASRGATPETDLRAPMPTRLSPIASLMCAVALGYALFDAGARVSHERIPTPLLAFGRTLHLVQGWSMFQHAAPRKSGFIVTTATLRDARTVSLSGDNILPLEWRRPDNIAASFESYRWRKEFENGVRPQRAHLEREAFAKYLCSKWRGSTTELQEVALYYLGTPARAGAAPHRDLLLRQSCGLASRPAIAGGLALDDSWVVTNIPR